MRGPIRHHPAWARSVIADHLGTGVCDPSLSPGVRALARRLDDPRDAGAMAGIARVIASTSRTGLEEACTIVAASFAEAPPPVIASPSTFDPRLVVCGEEAHRLLERAREAAENGVRILAYPRAFGSVRIAAK